MNLMQYLSVSGTLERPREKFLSRRIGSSQGDFSDEGGGDLAHPEPVALAEPAARETGQGEFVFVDPLVVDPKPSGPGNHLALEQSETRLRDRDQLEVYSRISPARVRVVRNDLAGSDLAVRATEGVEQFRPSLISEEPSRSSWSERMRGRLELLTRVSKWMSRRSWRWLLAFKSFWPAGILAGSPAGILKVAPKKIAEESLEQMNATELNEVIEMAKNYKTDVYVDGRVAWSYEEYASSVEEMVPIENANDL